MQSGTVTKDNGKFGFISMEGGADMFVMPAACVGFGNAIPPVGTPCMFEVVTDLKTGRPRAENVQPVQEMVHEAPSNFEASSHVAVASSSGRPAGVLLKDNGKFGFIQQDSGEADMFVMPAACMGFGNSMPPIGTRVEYDIVIDAKTGRPRAENVGPEGAGISGVAPAVHDSAYWPPAPAEALYGPKTPGIYVPHQNPKSTGTMLKDQGSFGFIQQDDGSEDMFIMPAACAALGGRLPALGARLQYDVVTDMKTGRPRAENVEYETPPPAHRQYGHAWREPPVMGYGMARSSPGFTHMAARYQPYDPPPYIPPQPLAAMPHPMHAAPALAPGQQTGSMEKDNGKFGFIRQDSGEPDMFVMPAACVAFGNALPPLGSRVLYTVVTDMKTGRPRAENVMPG